MDNFYAVFAISGDGEESTGTFIYTKPRASTGQISAVDSTGFRFVAALVFSTPNSGTYTVTSSDVPGASEKGTFVLHAGTSPADIAGSAITVNVTNGSFPFADSGSYRVVPGATAGSYSDTSISGAIANSSGTYAYRKNSPYTGVITVNDSVLGNGITAELSFDSPTTGTILARKPGSNGYQAGAFSISANSVPPSIGAHPVNQTANAGSTATFSVSANGTPPLAYQWRRDGRNIVGANSSSLVITSVKESDSGTYDVIVSNNAGSVTSSGASLIAVIYPSIVSHPASLSVVAGNSATFAAKASGSEPFSYQWRKNGADLPGATLSTYTIGNIQPEDSGAYSVRVSNMAGSINSNSAVLSVIAIATEPPVFSKLDWQPATGFTATPRVQPQTAYRIEWSADLRTWKDLTSFVSTGASAEIRDPVALVAGIRFYKGVSP